MSVCGEAVSLALSNINVSLTNLRETDIANLETLTNLINTNSTSQGSTNTALYTYIDTRTNTKIGTDISTAVAPINVSIVGIGSSITLLNNDIVLKLSTNDYTTQREAQDASIATSYLSKEEFNNYNLTEALKEAAQAVINTAVNSALEEVQSTVLILGTSLIAGTFTLGNELVNTVDEAFLNVDGRLINATNNIVGIGSSLNIINANIVGIGSSISTIQYDATLKADITYVDTKDIALSDAISLRITMTSQITMI